MNAKIISLNISERKGTIKKPVPECVLIENHGIDGDAHAGDWHRQVSLLGQESFDKMKNLGLDDLSSGIFAENITTEGVILYELPIGTLFRIGEAELQLTQIGKECHGGCEIQRKVGKCVMPHEGVFAKVLKGGKIKPGDDIEVIPPTAN